MESEAGGREGAVSSSLRGTSEVREDGRGSPSRSAELMASGTRWESRESEPGAAPGGVEGGGGGGVGKEGRPDEKAADRRGAVYRGCAAHAPRWSSGRQWATCGHLTGAPHVRRQQCTAPHRGMVTRTAEHRAACMLLHSWASGVSDSSCCTCILPSSTHLDDDGKWVGRA